jgi:hypothetical protein
VSYISDAARERARWITFEEAIEFVSRTVRCSRESADQQLRDACSDRKLFIRWEDQVTAAMRRGRQPTGHGSEAGPTPILDRPPDNADFWQHACIHDGKVFDPFTRRERTLLLLRFSVEQIWRKQPPAPPPLPAAPLPRGGRRPKLRNKVTKLLLDRNVDLTMPAKEIFRYVRDNWDKAKHPSDRTIVRAIEAAKEATAQG